MSGKMKRTIVLLLIMLNEAGPTAAWQDCSSCSSYCSCSSRGLSSVPQDLPTGITGLYLRYNVITTLNQSDFSRYSSLTTLDLRSNRISVINSGAFNNLTSLATLNLNNNQLASIRADMFVGLENLVYLYLHGNNIHSIEAGTFVNLPQLRNLRLNSNQLTSLTAHMFKGLDNLQTLDMSSNQLTSLTADMFKGLDDLDDLYLSHNDISTIEAGALANLTKLRDLNLSHNNISTFPMEAASNLNTSGFIYDLYEWPHLSINDNQMETLPPMAYDILASIRTVYISNNPWQCDCRMMPFKQKMTGFLAFEKQIGCAGPATLAGKSLLYLVDPEDLKCDETGSADGTSLGVFSLPLFLSSLGGVLVGAFLTSAVYSAVWCKIRRRKAAPNPVKYPRYRYASPRTAPSPELSLSVVDLNAEDTSVV